MKLYRYLTRDYTLAVHSHITESLLNSKISHQMGYDEIIDVYENGMVTAYVPKENVDRNHKCFIENVKKHPGFLLDMLNKGIEANKVLSSYPKGLPDKIKEQLNHRHFFRFFDVAGHFNFCYARHVVHDDNTEQNLGDKIGNNRRHAYQNERKEP